ncbi:hypothetical protein QBC36DRAFT_365186 [Triangularia setosa]|uniref:CFEM domain-containing protein n=1 Tax=Triangularia setosa TaxID=2587417 RepID=A0AAN6VYL8_9PEZI|nr:hypothetical protein QBC36DRAFT_365186 [Podospora setosa]
MTMSFTPTVALLLVAATTVLALVPTPVLEHNARSEITSGPSCGEFPCGSELTAIPSCAVLCIESAGLSLGCATTDYGCQCNNLDALHHASRTRNLDAIQGDAVLCVIDACGGFENAIPVVYSAVAMCQDANNGYLVNRNINGLTYCETKTKTITVGDGNVDGPAVTSTPGGSRPDEGGGFVSVTKTASGGFRGPVDTPKPGDGDGGDDGAGDDGDDGDSGSDGGDGEGPGDDDEPQGPSPTIPRPPVVTAGAPSNTIFIGATGLAGLLIMLAAFV